MHLRMLFVVASVGLCVSQIGATDSECATNVAVIAKNYPTANFDTCEIVDGNSFVLSIVPEDEPINPSPWYGFSVTRLGDVDDPVSVSLKYQNTQHRYEPKYSFDKLDWIRLAPQSIETIDERVVLTIPSSQRVVYVSAQPILDATMYADWYARVLDRYPFVSKQTIGYSVAKRPIDALVVNPSAKRLVVLLGRQHPPEITGAFAHLAFIEKLLDLKIHAHDDGSRDVLAFFRHHMMVFVPLINPDGVEAGYWRHNLQGVDLNRDWFTQAQPETQAVIAFLANLEAQGKEIVFHADFHSTRRDVLYTQMPEDETDPPAFATKWLAFAAQRGLASLPEHAPRPLTDQGTTKGYFFKTYGIPSITYEVGDETRLQDLRRTASELALGLASIYGEIVLDPEEGELEYCVTLFCHMVNANGASLLTLRRQGLIDPSLSRRIARSQLDYKARGEQQGWPNGQNYLTFEDTLIEELGAEASNMHIGRSRQDLHGIARRMLVRASALELYQSVLDSRKALLDVAEQHLETVIPAYTHGVPSQPTTYAHLLLAFDAALARDTKRLQQSLTRMNQSQLGVAAGSGSGLPLNRDRMAVALGFDGAIANTYDANFLSTADYKLELTSVVTQGMASISKFIANVHAQQRNPHPWIYLGDELVSGSSIMPQKRNPRELDRLRTLVAEVLGAASGIQLMNVNLDTGMHDYRGATPLVEMLTQTGSVYERFANLIRHIHVDAELAIAELEKGFSTSTDIAELLHQAAGVPFRTAHGYAKEIVDYARENDLQLMNVPDAALQTLYEAAVGNPLPISTDRVRQAMDSRQFVATRSHPGGPAASAVAVAQDVQRRELAADLYWLKVRRAMLRYAEDRLIQDLEQLAIR